MNLSYGRLLSFLLITKVILLSAFTAYKWSGNFEKSTFAYEYGNIAANVVMGTGYVNVFSWNENTGETAWCPPGYVGYFALIYKLFGVHTVTAHWALLILRIMMFVLVFYWIATLKKGNSLFACIVFGVILLYASYVIRQDVHDVTLNIFLSALTVNILVRYWNGNLKYANLHMLLLAIILPICNISLVLGLFCFYLGLALFKKSSFRAQMMPLTGCLVVVMLIFIGWGIRNKQALGAFYPFKSNLWYEFYLSNVVNRDGLIKGSDFYKYHPHKNETVRDLYKELGEHQFIQLYAQQSKEWLYENPNVFARNVWNRFSDAFIYLSNFDDLYVIDTERISHEDLHMLRNEGLAAGQYWSFFDLHQDEVYGRLDKLQLLNKNEIEKGVEEARSAFESNRYHRNKWKGVIWSILFSTLPFVTILISLFIRSIRTDTLFLFTLMLYLLMILPYVIVSFYHRYDYFQITFFVIFISLFLNWLLPNKLNLKWPNQPKLFAFH